MTSDLHRQYPRQRLLFFVAQDVDDEIVGAVKKMVHDLSAEKSWVLAPPAFIDHVDDARTEDGDVSDRTVGGTLDILGTQGNTQGNTLPRDLDAATFADVDRVVQAVQALSATWSLEVEFELNGAYVGAIDEGTLDRSLAEGLLGEWRRHLDAA